MTCYMTILGMWASLTKTFVAKEIQKCTFADSSENDADLFVPPRSPKRKMVAMAIKGRELAKCSSD